MSARIYRNDNARASGLNAPQLVADCLDLNRSYLTEVICGAHDISIA